MKLGGKHDRGPEMGHTKHELLIFHLGSYLCWLKLGPIKMWCRSRSCVRWQNKCMQCQDQLWWRWMMKLGEKHDRGPRMDNTKT